MNHEYEVRLEIAGPAAMFTRPDTGASQVSYPAPTFSAAKGIFETIARLETAYIRPTRAEICAPIRFHKYVTNYGGPWRKTEQVTAHASYQLVATILVDVRYRLYGLVEPVSEGRNGVNHLHALQVMFDRRLQKGQCFYTPFLGWKEFTPTYVGPLLPETRVEESIDLVIPSMLYAVFDAPCHGQVGPHYCQNVRINKGVIEYAQ